MIQKALVFTLTVALLTPAVTLAAGSKEEARGLVAPNEIHVVTVSCFSGEQMTAKLRGDGDTDLDLYIFSVYGEVVAFDEGPTDRAKVQWRATYTGAYFIVVNNIGWVSNLYRLTVR